MERYRLDGMIRDTREGPALAQSTHLRYLELR